MFNGSVRTFRRSYLDFFKAVFRATKTKAHFVRTPTFDPRKCCSMHECPLWRAALQHLEVVVNGGYGPKATVVDMGGNRTFAANKMKV